MTIFHLTDILLSARVTELRWVDLTNPADTGTVIPASNLEFLNYLAYDPVEEHVYWSDSTLDSISRCRLDGSGTTLRHECLQ